MAERFVTSIQIGALSNATRLILKAPDSGNGGGLTVLEASLVCGTVTSSVALTKYSSAATPALNGTIAAAIGGTASPFVAATPKDFTISTPFVDAGEWIAVVEGGIQAMDSAAVLNIACQFGR